MFCPRPIQINNLQESYAVRLAEFVDMTLKRKTVMEFTSMTVKKVNKFLSCHGIEANQDTNPQILTHWKSPIP